MRKNICCKYMTFDYAFKHTGEVINFKFSCKMYVTFSFSFIRIPKVFFIPYICITIMSRTPVR